MKKRISLLILISICSITFSSCLTYTVPNKTKVEKVGQFEGGNKDAGVVYMSVTYNPQTEEPTLNFISTFLKVDQVCKNWGFQGAKELQDPTVAKCQSFNSYNGQCILYKAVYKGYCK